MRNIVRYTNLASLLLTSIFVSAQGNGTGTGNPFQDAPVLNSYLKQLVQTPHDSALTNEILQLMNHYSKDPIKDVTSLNTLINGNNFLAGMSANMGPLPIKTAKATFENRDMVDVMVSATTSTPNLSANNIAGAIGTFIATRFKQEIETAFLSKLSDWIKNEKYNRTFTALMPETKLVLTQSNPYQYTTFLQSLKEAFNKDLTNLPITLEKYLAKPDPNDPLLKGVSTKPYYYPCIFVYNTVLQIKNFSSLVSEINSWADNADPLFNHLGSIKPFLQLISVVSTALSDDPSDNNPKYISTADIADGLNPKSGNLAYFAGLFLLQNKNTLEQITFHDNAANSKDIYDLLNTNYAVFKNITDWLRNTCTDLSNTGSSFEKVAKEANASKLIPDDVAACVNSLTASISDIFAFPFNDFGFTLDGTVVKTTQDILTNIQTLSHMAVDIQNKNYGLLFNHFVDLLQDNGVDQNSTALTFIKKYGNFAVSVVSATNQQEVIGALETAAMPVGSYRVKRTSYIDLALNAYAGLFYGYQQFESSTPTGVNSTNTLFGFTAPVGISFSWGFLDSKHQPNGSSGTLFLSVIDVGAVTAFRLQNDATSTLPSFSWSNILTPGAYLIYGFKSSPLSLGFGAN